MRKKGRYHYGISSWNSSPVSRSCSGNRSGIVSDGAQRQNGIRSIHIHQLPAERFLPCPYAERRSGMLPVLLKFPAQFQKGPQVDNQQELLYTEHIGNQKGSHHPLEPQNAPVQPYPHRSDRELRRRGQCPAVY